MGGVHFTALDWRGEGNNGIIEFVEDEGEVGWSARLLKVRISRMHPLPMTSINTAAAYITTTPAYLRGIAIFSVIQNAVDRGAIGSAGWAGRVVAWLDLDRCEPRHVGQELCDAAEWDLRLLFGVYLWLWLEGNNDIGSIRGG
ncbi:hypothetical protein O988_06775 [Pseudogymnoascus sp. VKM F-3808]|nr:hypothetical protein O988_06775 [Pseudogymnoascus sp. VKM F-3808]